MVAPDLSCPLTLESVKGARMKLLTSGGAPEEASFADAHSPGNAAVCLGQPSGTRNDQRRYPCRAPTISRTRAAKVQTNPRMAIAMEPPSASRASQQHKAMPEHISEAAHKGRPLARDVWARHAR